MLFVFAWVCYFDSVFTHKVIVTANYFVMHFLIFHNCWEFSSSGYDFLCDVFCISLLKSSQASSLFVRHIRLFSGDFLVWHLVSMVMVLWSDFFLPFIRRFPVSSMIMFLLCLASCGIANI